MNRIFSNYYKICKNKFGNDIILGQGSFSKVKKAINIKNSFFFAIKIIKKKGLKNYRNYIDNEYNLHKYLEHKSIIKLYYKFED